MSAVESQRFAGISDHHNVMFLADLKQHGVTAQCGEVCMREKERARLFRGSADTPTRTGAAGHGAGENSRH
jgi:hypothetical protein